MSVLQILRGIRMRAQLRIVGLVFLIAMITTMCSWTCAQNTSQPQDPPSKPESDTEVVRVETNLVNTLFTAVDKDRHFITSLRVGDIRIFENDVAQPLSLFERETD